MKTLGFRKVLVLPVLVILVLTYVMIFSTPAQSAPVKPTILKFAVATPPGGRTDGFKWWGDEVEKRSGGRVKFEFYWEGSLVPAKETLEAVKSGVADIGEIINNWYVNQWPLSQIAVLPGTTDDHLLSVQAWRKVVETIPEVRKEITKFNQVPIFWQPTADYNVEVTKPFRSLADMKGAKIRIFGSTYPKVLSVAAGVVTVSMVSPEVYEAMLRGTVAGTLSTHETAFRYKWYEVAPYMMMWRLGCPTTVNVTVNQDVWNKLPADIQQIMLDVGKEQEKWVADFYKKTEAQYIKEMKAKRYEIIELSATDMQVIQKASSALWDEIVAQYEAKGLPAKKVIEVYRAALGKK